MVQFLVDLQAFNSLFPFYNTLYSIEVFKDWLHKFPLWNQKAFVISSSWIPTSIHGSSYHNFQIFINS